MILSELMSRVDGVSRSYAEAFEIERSADWLLLKLHEEVGELTQAHLEMQGSSRPRGRSAEEIRGRFAVELADVVCHALLIAQHHGIDLESEIDRKWLSCAR